MKNKFVKDLEDNMQISEKFAVVDKVLGKSSRTNRTYATVKLADRTGSITGKIWEDADKKFALFEKGDVVLIEGRTSTYRGVLEIHIDKIRKCAEGEFDTKDFLPSSGRSTEEMEKDLKEFVSSVKNEYLRILLESVFEDEKFLKRFEDAPASVNVHHSYVGGLIEHTLNVAKICDTVAGIYGGIDRDLLVTGALLHDIGKVEEYEVSSTIMHTNGGMLVGHIIYGTIFVKNKIDKIEGFPEELETEVLHLIASHHGEYEFGSPKLPQTAEAAALAYADLLDSKTESFLEIKNALKDEWSNYIGFLERRIYRGSTNGKENSSGKLSE